MAPQTRVVKEDPVAPAPPPKGIRYREDLGAWWPDYDHAPVKCMQFVRAGLPAVDRVAHYCHKMRVAVQAGGHAGFWPIALAAKFGHVHTFEPERALFDCMVRNCTAPNVTMYRHGLGATCGTVSFRSHVSAGSWRVDPVGEHKITLLTVDTLKLEALDALCLDIEGYEVEALAGAAETIQRCRPVILCELLPRSADQIAAWLAGAGYVQRERYGRDGIYTFRGRA
jgi:FkbM family methyltransferase